MKSFRFIPKSIYASLTIISLSLLLASCGNDKSPSKDASATTTKDIETPTKDEANKDHRGVKTDIETGKTYALSTKKILGKNLKAAITKGGTLEALKFCNLEAYNLTDSMSTLHGALIKRVSDKPRNPANQANPEELKYIEMFKKMLASNSKVTPVITKKNGKTQFYAPILTNGLCLQCHGKPNDQIQKDVLSALAELYPNDKAQGYDPNQVRGIWRIEY